MPKLSLFISSPGDVNEERVIAARVIARIAEEFARRVTLEPIFWEHEPMLMTETFQTQILPPSQADIFIGILWARIGTRLPANITRADGSRYASGSEFEFEDAWAGFEKTGLPEILIYRKTAKPLITPDMPDFAARMAQKEALDAFARQWFQDEEGSFIAAFNPFENLAEFEVRLEAHLRKLLLRRFPSDDADTHVRHITWHDGSPFRGLGFFEAHHAPIFFGRTRVISEVLGALRKNALEAHPFIMLLGMSGSGKSSLVRAGVLPMLTQAGVIEGVAAWRQAILRPSDCGADLLEGFSKCLFAPQGLPQNPALAQHSQALNTLLQTFLRAQAWRDMPARATEYAHLEQAISQFISDCLLQAEQAVGVQAGQVRLVLVVEQFEELFLQENMTWVMRKTFVDLIYLLVRSKLCWVIATLRSDLFYRCAELPVLAKLLEGSGQYLLTAPNIGELTQMIRLPAFAAGLQFETHPRTQERLDDVLLQLMLDNPESLALLSFTLDALYEKRDAHGYLTFAAYEQLGGLEGALARRAEDVFQQVSVQAQARFSTLMRTLITVSSNDATPICGRRFLYTDEKFDKALQELLDALADAGLIVIGQDSDGVAIARIAHNALLQHWPRLSHWLQENQHLLRMRVRLKDAARHWHEEARAAEFLLSEGRTLSNSKALLHQWSDALDPYVIEYIEASHANLEQQKIAARHKAERKLRQSRYLLISFGFLTLFALIGSVYGYLGQQAAQRQARIAEQAKRTAEQHAAEAQVSAMLAQQEKYLAQRTQSQFLVSLSQQQTAQGNAVNGVLLALEALPRNILKATRPYLVEAEIALREALAQLREHLILRGHTDAVWNLSFSPDGAYLLSAADDHTARLWDARTGQPLRVFQGHTHQVWHAKFNPQQDRILTASLDRTARLWDPSSDQELLILQGHEGELYFADWSPDGSKIVTASADKTLRLWDAQSGRLLHLLRGHQAAVLNADFSPDGKWLVSASRDHTARLWEVATGELLQTLTGHSQDLNHAIFHPDGTRIISDSEDGSVRLWQLMPNLGKQQGVAEPLPTYQLLRTLKHSQANKLIGVAISPNGQYLLSYATDKTAHLWDFQGNLLHIFYGHEHVITDAQFSHDSQSVISVSKDRSLRLWRVTDGAQIGIMAGHTAAIQALALSPDNRQIATASADHSVRLWHHQPTGHLAILDGHREELRQLQFSDNEQRFLTLSDQLAQVWDSVSQKRLAAFSAEQELLYSGVLSPDGKTLLISQSDDFLYVWNVDSGALQARYAVKADAVIAVKFNHQGNQWLTISMNGKAHLWQADGTATDLIGHQDSIIAAYFSPDDQRLISISRDHNAMLWEIPSGKPIAILSGAKDALTHAVFSADSRRVLTVSEDGEARLWNALNSELLQIFLGHEGGIFDADFSPDGRRIVTASWDNSIRLWNTASGKTETVLRAHRDWVTFVSFTPDGQHLLSASRDGSVRLWDLPTQRQLGVLNPYSHNLGKPTYSPHGTYLLTQQPDNKVVLWRVLSSTQAVIDYAEQHVPRRLTTAQRYQFFLGSTQ